MLHLIRRAGMGALLALTPVVLAPLALTPGPAAAETAPAGSKGRFSQRPRPPGGTVTALRGLPRLRANDTHTERGGTIRLVTGLVGEDGRVTAALHILLDEGFKTYWRNPGQSGIPPSVSFNGSRNLADMVMVLPPPHVFREPNDVTVGYKGEVVFPITATVMDPSRPFRLRASGQVGFCAAICVPVAFDIETTGETGPSPFTANRILLARNAIVAPSDELQVTRALYDPERHRLDVEAAVPDADMHLELILEAGEAGVELPVVADTVHQEGAQATFSFDLNPATPLEAGATLRTTLVIGRFGEGGGTASQPGAHSRKGVEQVVEVELAD